MITKEFAREIAQTVFQEFQDFEKIYWMSPREKEIVDKLAEVVYNKLENKE